MEKEPKFIKRYNTFDRKHIRCCKTIGDDTKIIGSEDGIISIIKGQKENIQSNLELEESNMFMEEEKNEMIGKPIKNVNFFIFRKIYLIICF